MHLTPPSDQKLSGLLFYLLRERGIHIYDNRAFVMTTAHSEADLQRADARVPRQPAGDACERVLRAVRVAATRRSRRDRNSRREQGRRGRRRGSGDPAAGAFPLTEAQKEIWLAAQMGGDAAVAYNESLKLEFRGAFDVDLFRKPPRQVVQRHPILLASFSRDGAVAAAEPRCVARRAAPRFQRGERAGAPSAS